MRNFIKQNISGRKVLFLFLFTNTIYFVMLFITIPKVMNFSNGMKLLDMMPTGYSADYVNKLFDTLGEQGRNVYLYKQLPMDMIYPFLFAISSCLLLAYFLNKLNKLDSNYFYLCFIPVCAGIFDYAENIGIITMLNRYPNISNLLSKATNVSSIIKSFSTTVYFLILLLLFILFGIRFFFRNRK